MEFQIFGDCDMEHQDISSQEHVKSRNAERDYCESRRFERKNVRNSVSHLIRKRWDHIIKFCGPLI
jgi:hypothetical protein